MQHGEYTDDFDDFVPRSLSDRDDDGDDEAPRRAAPRTGKGGGTGRVRSRDGDGDGNGLMAMSRRDPVREAKSLYRDSLEDMRNFLHEREVPDPMHSVSGVAVTALEIAAGAGLAAFLSQRFRQAGALVPVGVTLGVLGLAASQFNMLGKFSPDLRNFSFGAGASAIALWAAGRGIIANDATAAAASATSVVPTPTMPPTGPGGVAVPNGSPPGGVAIPVTGAVCAGSHPHHTPPHVPHAPYAHVPPQAFPMPQVPQPMVAMASSDFHELVSRAAGYVSHGATTNGRDDARSALDGAREEFMRRGRR